MNISWQIFKKYIIYLFGRRGEAHTHTQRRSWAGKRRRRTESSPTQCFTPQMPLKPGTGTPLQVSHMGGRNHLSHHCCLPRSEIVGTLSQETEHCSNPGTLIYDMGHVTARLNARDFETENKACLSFFFLITRLNSWAYFLLDVPSYIKIGNNISEIKI